MSKNMFFFKSGIILNICSFKEFFAVFSKMNSKINTIKAVY